MLFSYFVVKLNVALNPKQNSKLWFNTITYIEELKYKNLYLVLSWMNANFFIYFILFFQKNIIFENKKSKKSIIQLLTKLSMGFHEKKKKC